MVVVIVIMCCVMLVIVCVRLGRCVLLVMMVSVGFVIWLINGWMCFFIIVLSN